MKTGCLVLKHSNAVFFPNEVYPQIHDVIGYMVKVLQWFKQKKRHQNWHQIDNNKTYAIANKVNLLGWP